MTGEEYGRAARRVCAFSRRKYDQVLAELRAQMEKAAADTRFEAAAKTRDDIEGLELTIGGQRVGLARGSDVDALGYEPREDRGCLALIRVGDGRVVGQDARLLEGLSRIPTAGLVNELTELHCQKSPDAPKEVLLSISIEDSGVLEAFLGERRGGKVCMRAPRRGRKRDLVAMATGNAGHHLKTLLERVSVERRAT